MFYSAGTVAKPGIMCVPSPELWVPTPRHGFCFYSIIYKKRVFQRETRKIFCLIFLKFANKKRREYRLFHLSAMRAAQHEYKHT